LFALQHDLEDQAMASKITCLHIRAMNNISVAARLHLGHMVFPCIIGRNGRTFSKREGDGKTPIGRFWLRQGFYRADRFQRPSAARGLKPLQKSDGWCEVPGSGHYNRHVKLPFRHGHETMWREDSAYDVVFATSHNECPRVQGKGSAIFFHLTREGSGVTAGCVAVKASDMRKILSLCREKVMLVVWPT
jgi:L,D-peptidoglycan transpeptidase YkuD (ErfK/YbiS/YcfS/YnhG family)